MINARCACGEVYNVSDDKKGYGLICAKCGQIIDLASPRSSALTIRRSARNQKIWLIACVALLLVGSIRYISYSAGLRAIRNASPATQVEYQSPHNITSTTPLGATIKQFERHPLRLAHQHRHQNEPPTQQVVQPLPVVADDARLAASVTASTVVAQTDVPHLALFYPTGTSIMPPIDESGRGTLTVINGNKENAVVKLVGAADPLSPLVAYRYVYINAGDQFTISKIPPGSYSLLYSIGRDWNSQDSFNEYNASYRFGKTLDFSQTTTATDNGGSQTEWSNLTVTLHSVLTGTVEAQQISKQDFDTPH